MNSELEWANQIIAKAKEFWRDDPRVEEVRVRYESSTIIEFEESGHDSKTDHHWTVFGSLDNGSVERSMGAFSASRLLALLEPQESNVN